LLRDNYITLYNVYRDREGENEEFNRTIMYVHLEENKGRAESNTSEDSTSTSTLFVPFVVQNECKKTYVEPEEYMQMSDHSKVFTFRKGDIVLKGKCEEEISSERDFLMKHTDVLRVRECDNYNFGSMSMRHWEVYCD